MSTNNEPFVSWSFYHTFYDRHHLPKGVFLVGDSSVFYGWPCCPIVQCRGLWPDHDRSSGEVCDPDAWEWYHRYADRDVEFYENSLDPRAQVLYCNETEIFLRDLVTSTPALEKEIRRRDDEERIPAEAARRASAARFEAEQERERQRRQAMTPQERKQEEDAAVDRVRQAVRRATMPFGARPSPRTPTQQVSQLPPATPVLSAAQAKFREEMLAGRIPYPSAQVDELPEVSAPPVKASAAMSRPFAANSEGNEHVR
jgi:hypothetical protein